MIDCSVTVGGSVISGWTGVEVTRGIEICPSSFKVSATSNSPIYSDAVGIVEGSPCTVSLGSNLVITGYVDTVAPHYDAKSHGVIIAGRGKCADLVDCSSEWPTSFIGNANLLDIATKLLQPYGITASALADTGSPIPQFQVNLGETPWSIIERIARHAALLVYEGSDGNLVFAQGGSTQAASGFTEEQNVQAASVMRSQAERYSWYFCSMLSMRQFSDVASSEPFFAKIPDPGVQRNRKLYVIASSDQPTQDMVQRRAAWEMNRRYARGSTVTVTADSWTDAADALWTPNTLAPVTLPRLGVSTLTMCIGEVTYLRDEGGSSARVTLAPPAAYAPQPIQLQSIFRTDPEPSS